MKARTRYVPNRRGFEALAVGQEVRAAVTDVAEKAQGTAETLTSEISESGHYAESFQIDQDTVTDATGAHPHTRAAAILVNAARYAAAVEAGHQDAKTGKTVEGHHILRRTLERLEAEE